MADEHNQRQIEQPITPQLFHLPEKTRLVFQYVGKGRDFQRIEINLPMIPTIEILDNKVYYSIPELDIEIELQIANGSLEPGFFTDEASEEYWDENWERIEEECEKHLAENGILVPNRYRR